MLALYLMLWIASWGTFGATVVWLSVTERRIHPDVALLLRAVLTLLLIAGVIFMTLTLDASTGLEVAK